MTETPRTAGRCAQARPTDQGRALLSATAALRAADPIADTGESAAVMKYFIWAAAEKALSHVPFGPNFYHAVGYLHMPAQMRGL